jgi:hypothetical protein
MSRGRLLDFALAIVALVTSETSLGGRSFAESPDAGQTYVLLSLTASREKAFFDVAGNDTAFWRDGFGDIERGIVVWPQDPEPEPLHPPPNSVPGSGPTSPVTDPVSTICAKLAKLGQHPKGCP